MPPRAVVTVHRGWLALAFVIAFVATGVAHWPVPYSQVSLPNSLMGPGLIAVALAAVMARVYGRAIFLSGIIGFACAATGAVMATLWNRVFKN